MGSAVGEPVANAHTSGDLQVALDAVPLRGGLVLVARSATAASALTSSASVSGIRPTLRRVKRVRESNSGCPGASYQMT